MKAVNIFLYNDFIFSPRFRVWRHLLYWAFNIILWAIFWRIMGSPASLGQNLFNMALWVPVFVLFGYPLAYLAIPRLLLKGRVWQFMVVTIGWGVMGIWLNNAFRAYVYVPIQFTLGFEIAPQTGFQVHSYLCMTTSAASPMIIHFYKLWSAKQRDWLAAEKERISAELQLLKAQVHPRFLFNTLNNIHGFALGKSSKTPEMILKLSSLLSYMLYDCRSEEVRLKKEIESMKNYIDLEKERFGNMFEISWSVEGNAGDKFIAPLLLLPFLENAFKHGASGPVDKPWMSIDISISQQALRFKVANSKSEFVYCKDGIGIINVRKRLDFIYPGQYELKINDEGNFYVVAMIIKLYNEAPVFVSKPVRTVKGQTTPA